MIQFYFLSVFLNILTGMILVFNKEDSFINKIVDTKSNIFRLVVGILAVFVSIVKLLSPVNGIPFFGDFVPFLVGIFGGGAVLVQYFTENSNSDVELPEIVKTIFIDCQIFIGYACFACAVIHFICPSVLFL